MRAKHIPYRDTGKFSKLVLDYVESDITLRPFYTYLPTIEGIKAAIENKRFTGNRNVLSEELLRQYDQIETPERVRKNIESLIGENTYTITTGHQLNIFTGPLYFIYKIVSAINLSNQLNILYADKHFVPVYWMATEDHDFEEINHVYLDGKNIQWNAPASGATGNIEIGSLTETLKTYCGYLGLSHNGMELAKLVDSAYGGSTTLSEATRKLVNGLFGKFGLVILDGSAPALKNEFKSVMTDDILHQHSFLQIGKTTSKLESSGYRAQVHSRQINFFYMIKGLRERLEKQGEHFKVVNASIVFTKEELIQEIENFPERFSPNVVMRPLYQESILPNIAYIGGGAEVAYWMQLSGVFNYYGVQFPAVILRNSVQVVDHKSYSRLRHLGLDAALFFGDIESIKTQWIISHSANNGSFNSALNELVKVFNDIKNQVSEVDSTLVASVESACVRSKKLIVQLEKKLIRAEKKKQADTMIQIEQVKDRLFPGGILQERVVNIAPMYIEFGSNFIATLIEMVDPLDMRFMLILPNE